jgi:MFS family permease
MQRSDESERSVDDLLADVERSTGGETARDGERENPASNSETVPSFASASPVSSRGSSVRRRLGGLFSLRTFLVALVLSVAAVVVGGFVPVVGRLVGLFAVAFLIGIVGSERRYVEVGLAGALASGLGFVASTLTSAFFPFAVRLLAEYGVAVAGVGAGVGALAALVGHYVGRDLRDGLTREL